MKKKPPLKKGQQNKPLVNQASGKERMPVPQSKRNVNLPFYLLFGFVLVLYGNSIFNKYALDDRLLITENAFTKKGFSGIKDILTTDSFVGFFGKQKNLVAGGRYRPLSHITFAIEYGILKDFNAGIGHLINILLYALACLLVYKVLTMVFPPGKTPFYLTFAFIATVLFIAHPLHVEDVANVKGRDEIMGILGSFGTFYFILKYIQQSRPINLLWAVLVFFLGLMSKEDVVTFIAVIPLTLYYFTKAKPKEILISTGCLLGVTIFFIAIRASVLGFLLNSNIDFELLNNPFLGASAAQKFATILLTWGKYLLLLIFPHPLTHDYYPKQIPIINFNDVRAIIPLLIYSSMIIYALWRFKKKEIITYSILFFGLTFSISSNLIFPIGTFMNDRFMFTPLLGFCMVLAYLATVKFKVWFGEEKLRTAIFIFIGIILLGYSVKTISRNPTWHDDYTLFTTDVKVSTNSAKCNVSAGGQTMELAEKELDPAKKKEMLNTALNFLKRGVAIHPKYGVGWFLLGKVMIDLENYSKAREYNDSALVINPGDKKALNNWIYSTQMSVKNKDYNEAILSYTQLSQLQPTNTDYIIDIADVYENKNQIDSAISVLNRLLTKNPNNVAALNKIGEIYGKHLNDINRSIEFLLKAYSISPSDASLLQNIGVAYGILKKFDKSIEFFKKALAVSPDNSSMYMNLASTYKGMGDDKKAAEYSARAADLQKQNK